MLRLHHGFAKTWAEYLFRSVPGVQNPRSNSDKTRIRFWGGELSLKLVYSHFFFNIIKIKVWLIQIKWYNRSNLASVNGKRQQSVAWWVCTGVQQRWARWDVDFLQELQCFSMKETNGRALGECHPHSSTGASHVCNADQWVWMDLKLLWWKQQWLEIQAT